MRDLAIVADLMQQKRRQQMRESFGMHDRRMGRESADIESLRGMGIETTGKEFGMGEAGKMRAMYGIGERPELMMDQRGPAPQDFQYTPGMRNPDTALSMAEYGQKYWGKNIPGIKGTRGEWEALQNQQPLSREQAFEQWADKTEKYQKEGKKIEKNKMAIAAWEDTITGIESGKYGGDASEVKKNFFDDARFAIEKDPRKARMYIAELNSRSKAVDDYYDIKGGYRFSIADFAAYGTGKSGGGGGKNEKYFGFGEGTDLALYGAQNVEDAFRQIAKDNPGLSRKEIRKLARPLTKQQAEDLKEKASRKRIEGITKREEAEDKQVRLSQKNKIMDEIEGNTWLWDSQKRKYNRQLNSLGFKLSKDADGNYVATSVNGAQQRIFEADPRKSFKDKKQPWE